MTPATTAPLTVGLVGAGDMGRTHLDAWRHLGYEPLVYVRRAPAAPLASPPPRWTDDLDHLVVTAEVVDICTPTDTHAALVDVAVAAGKHVICEKPLALDHREATHMIDSARAAGVQLHIAHVVRYFEAYALARELVHTGAVGRLTALQLSRTGPAPAGEWFFDTARSGGVLTDQMIHDFDYARWVAGEVAGVRAEVVDRPGGAITATATLQHASGVTSQLAGGWLGPESVFTTGFSLTGTSGELRYRSTDPSLRLVRPGTGSEPGRDSETGQTDKTEQTWPMSDDRPYAAQLAEFVAAIAGGPPPRVTTEDALAAVDLTAAARRASGTGKNESPDEHG